MGRAYYDTVDGDWTAIAVPMRLAIRNNREAIARNSIIAHPERPCRQMQVVEHLLDRLIDGDAHDIGDARYPEVAVFHKTGHFKRTNNGYFELAHTGIRPRTTRAWAKFITEIERQDVQMLARYMKYLTHWWD